MKEEKECIGQHYFEVQKLDGETYIVCRKCGRLRQDVENMYPQDEGSREMWAVLGRGGGIYAFANKAKKAEWMQRQMWNIGKRKPIKYLVKFKKIC